MTSSTIHSGRLSLSRMDSTIFKRLMDQPELDTTLSQWASEVGASERTLSRLFTKEFNMSYPLWRRNLRLVCSLN
ncbi:MAG: hypothetical protein ACPHL6_10480, partial [Rubripirellula sp.]